MPNPPKKACLNARKNKQGHIVILDDDRISDATDLTTDTISDDHGTTFKAKTVKAVIRRIKIRVWGQRESREDAADMPPPPDGTLNITLTDPNVGPFTVPMDATYIDDSAAEGS